MNKAFNIIVDFYNNNFSNKNYKHTIAKLIINIGHPYQKSIKYDLIKMIFSLIVHHI